MPELSLLLLLILTVILFILCIVYLRCSKAVFISDVSLNGKVVIVTGANAGIGFHTAMGLARRGARVVLACRSDARGNNAREAIIATTGNQNVVYKHLDLSSLKSVRQFAAHILDTEPNLHVLVNNAGVYGYSDYTEDGIVESMQINYFGHFLLTLLLLPLLKTSQPSRIINMSSILHFFGMFDLKHLNSNEHRIFQSWRNYCDSKFLMLMFSVELSRRLQGTGVVANAAHPGVILTSITAPGSIVTRALFWCWCQLYNRSAEEGAQTIEFLAASEDNAQVSGKYFVDCASRIMLSAVKSETDAKLLWDYSVKLVGYNANIILKKQVGK